MIHDDGKRLLLDSQDWIALLELVDPRSSINVLLPACTALGAFSAHPAGREALLSMPWLYHIRASCNLNRTF